MTINLANTVADASHPYRLYRMSALSGEIHSVESFGAFSDDEAIGRALDQAGDHRIELWHNGRKLAAISGGDGPTELSIAPPED